MVEKGRIKAAMSRMNAEPVKANSPECLALGGLAKIAPLSSSAFFLDVDGTLLDIKPRPEDVVADEKTRALLMGLAEAANGALALISGRAIADIDRIFAPLVFSASGLHGAEIRFPDGSRRCSDSTVMDHLRPLVERFVAAFYPRLRLEDKGAALALHFRQAPEFGKEVLEFLRPLAQKNKLAIQEGKMVAELKEGQHDKAKAIAALLKCEPFASRKPVFIGDDLTDECGFLLVNALGGISVRAGAADYASAAQYCLPDPSGVRAELRQLLTSI
jgi:trehalose 6-phosphate phosphatase